MRFNPIKFWKEFSAELKTADHVLLGKSKSIVSPSEQTPYHQQFETRVSYTGDILNFLPPYSSYNSFEQWEAQLIQHQAKIDRYIRARFNFISQVTLVIGTSISIICSLSSLYWMHGDMQEVVIAFTGPTVVTTFFFLLLRQWVRRAIPKIILWFVVRKSKFFSFYRNVLT